MGSIAIGINLDTRAMTTGEDRAADMEESETAREARMAWWCEARFGLFIHWGHTDTNWKSTETLIRMLVDTTSKNGNFLLNVGPDSDGLIPDASAERLREIGRWMEKPFVSDCLPTRRIASTPCSAWK